MLCGDLNGKEITKEGIQVGASGAGSGEKDVELAVGPLESKVCSGAPSPA